MADRSTVNEFGSVETRAKFNQKLARQIEAYWLSRGYQIEARVGVGAEIESSTMNGWPHKRKLPPRGNRHYLKNTTQKELDEIKEAVCRFHQVTRDEVDSYDRRPHVAMARHDLAYRLFIRDESYADIGRALNRNHASIMSSVKRWKKVGRDFSL